MPRKQPDKPFADQKWSRSKFYGFLRSALRRASVRWPPIHSTRKAARRAYSGPNKRQKWEFRCERCGGWFMGKETQVHHKIPCGELRDYQDLPRFVERLFCERDGLEIVCSACHDKAHAEAKHTDTQQ